MQLYRALCMDGAVKKADDRVVGFIFSPDSDKTR